MIGVQTVAAPRIVAEQCLGAHRSDDPGNLPSLIDAVDQFAVDPLQEQNPLGSRPDAPPDARSGRPPAAASTIWCSPTGPRAAGTPMPTWPHWHPDGSTSAGPRAVDD